MLCGGSGVDEWRFYRELRGVAGKGRLGHLVVGITVEAGEAELVFAVLRTVYHRILVIGKQVVQYLPGRNAEGKQQQQGEGCQGSYGGICAQIQLIQGCKLGKLC